MEQSEKDDLRAFLTTLYGQQVNGWPMSERMFNVTYRMLNESESCSDAMDHVPRPMPPGSQPIRWITKEVRRALLRKLKDRREHYHICLKRAAVVWASEFHMAAAGL